MLTALTTTQRLQTMQLLDISKMIKGKNAFKFEVTELVKQSKPGRKPPDRRLCVQTVLAAYLERTTTSEIVKLDCL